MLHGLHNNTNSSNKADFREDQMSSRVSFARLTTTLTTNTGIAASPKLILLRVGDSRPNADHPPEKRSIDRPNLLDDTNVKPGEWYAPVPFHPHTHKPYRIFVLRFLLFVPPYLEPVLLGADDGLDGEGQLLGVPHVGDGVAHQRRQDLLRLDVRGAVALEDLRRVEAFPQQLRRQLQQLTCSTRIGCLSFGTYATG